MIPKPRWSVIFPESLKTIAKHVKLSCYERDILLMRLLERYSLAAAGRALGISRQAIWSAQRKATAKIINAFAADIKKKGRGR